MRGLAAHRAAASTARDFLLTPLSLGDPLTLLVVGSDPLVNLAAVIGVVGERRPNFGVRHVQDIGSIRELAVVRVQCVDHLPYIKAAKPCERGSPPGRSLCEDDPRMLIHVQTLFHISLYEIRPRLAEPPGMTVQPPQDVGTDARGKVSLSGPSHNRIVTRCVLLCSATRSCAQGDRMC